MFHPTRGGTRGGKDQFDWKDVKDDKHRENYLGHSLMAPVGRWQKDKDLTWYAKESKDDTKSKAHVAELARIKEAEAEAMAIALGVRKKKTLESHVTEDDLKHALNKDGDESDEDNTMGVDATEKGLGYGKGSSRFSQGHMQQQTGSNTVEIMGANARSFAASTNTNNEQEEPERKHKKKHHKKHHKHKSDKKKKRKSHHNSSSDDDTDEERSLKHRRHYREDEGRYRSSRRESRSRSPYRHHHSSGRRARDDDDDDSHSRRPRNNDSRRYTHDRSTRHEEYKSSSRREEDGPNREDRFSRREEDRSSRDDRCSRREEDRFSRSKRENDRYDRRQTSRGPEYDAERQNRRDSYSKDVSAKRKDPSPIKKERSLSPYSKRVALSRV